MSVNCSDKFTGINAHFDRGAQTEQMETSRESNLVSRSVSQKGGKVKRTSVEVEQQKHYLQKMLQKPQHLQLRADERESMMEISRQSKMELSLNCTKNSKPGVTQPERPKHRASLLMAERYLPRQLRTQKDNQESTLVRPYPTQRDGLSRLDGSWDKMPVLLNKQSVEKKAEKSCKGSLDLVKNSPSFSNLLKPVVHRASLQAVLKVGEEILSKSTDQQNKPDQPKACHPAHRKSPSGVSVIEKIAEKIAFENKLLIKPKYRGSLLLPSKQEECLIAIDGAGDQSVVGSQTLRKKATGDAQSSLVAMKRHSTLRNPFLVGKTPIGVEGAVKSLNIPGDSKIETTVNNASACATIQTTGADMMQTSLSGLASKRCKNIVGVLQNIDKRIQEQQNAKSQRQIRHRRVLSDVYETAGKLLNFSTDEVRVLQNVGTGRSGSLVRLKIPVKNTAQLILQNTENTEIGSNQHYIQQQREVRLTHNSKIQEKRDIASPQGTKFSSETTKCTQLHSASTSDLCSWLLSDPFTNLITIAPKSTESDKQTTGTVSNLNRISEQVHLKH